MKMQSQSAWTNIRGNAPFGFRRRSMEGFITMCNVLILRKRRIATFNKEEESIPGLYRGRPVLQWVLYSKRAFLAGGFIPTLQKFEHYIDCQRNITLPNKEKKLSFLQKNKALLIKN